MRLEGATFSLFDRGGAPATAVELNHDNDAASDLANNPRLVGVTVYLTDAPGAFPVFPFAREVAYNLTAETVRGRDGKGRGPCPST